MRHHKAHVQGTRADQSAIGTMNRPLHDDRFWSLTFIVLIEHHVQLTKLTQTLLEREQLNRAEFEALLSEIH